MTVAQLNDLGDKVLQILQSAPEPLSLRQIEHQLYGQVEADTFDIRDAVWRLVAEKKAEFTPWRHVKLAK